MESAVYYVKTRNVQHFPITGALVGQPTVLAEATGVVQSSAHPPQPWAQTCTRLPVGAAPASGAVEMGLVSSVVWENEL